jgi:hypothetical protein
VVDLPPARRIPQIARVTEFDEARGIGKVETGSGRRFAFHCTAITDGTRMIVRGTLVAVEVAPGHLGRLEASSVRPLPGVVTPGATLEGGSATEPLGSGAAPAAPAPVEAPVAPADEPTTAVAPIPSPADEPTTAVGPIPSPADEPTTAVAPIPSPADEPTTAVAPIPSPAEQPPAYDWALDAPDDEPTGEDGLPSLQSLANWTPPEPEASEPAGRPPATSAASLLGEEWSPVVAEPPPVEEPDVTDSVPAFGPIPIVEPTGDEPVPAAPFAPAAETAPFPVPSIDPSEATPPTGTAVWQPAPEVGAEQADELPPEAGEPTGELPEQRDPNVPRSEAGEPTGELPEQHGPEGTGPGGTGSYPGSESSVPDPTDPGAGSPSDTPIVPPVPRSAGSSGANFWSPHPSSPAGPPPTWVTPVTRRDPSPGSDDSSTS